MLEEFISGFGQGILVMGCVYYLIMVPVVSLLEWIERKGTRP
jgi:hypothetical protein